MAYTRRILFLLNQNITPMQLGIGITTLTGTSLHIANQRQLVQKRQQSTYAKFSSLGKMVDSGKLSPNEAMPLMASMVPRYESSSCPVVRTLGILGIDIKSKPKFNRP